MSSMDRIWVHTWSLVLFAVVPCARVLEELTGFADLVDWCQLCSYNLLTVLAFCFLKRNQLVSDGMFLTKRLKKPERAKKTH